MHLPRHLWEYRREHPVRASVYFSGLLAAPRLTGLWLLATEPALVARVHEAALARLNALLERAAPDQAAPAPPKVSPLLCVR